MLYFGKIIEVSGHKARVQDLESGSETDWLVILVPLAGINRVKWAPPAIGDRVAYTEYGEGSGAILGAFYDDANEPPGDDDTVTITMFGFTITITSAGAKLGTTTEKAVKGDTLKTLLENFITALKLHTHATAGTGAPSPPDPAALTAFDTFSSGLSGALATKVEVE